MNDARAAVNGRERELAEMAAHIADSAQSHGGFLFLSGEPGAGKTVLLEEACRIAAAAGFSVLRARAFESTVAPTYQPIAAALTSSATPAEWRASAGDLFDRVAPYLGWQDGGVPIESAPTIADGRPEFFDDLGQLLTAAARAGRPTLLAIDDLHWADVPTLVFLRQLAPALGGLPFLVAGTYRTASAGRGTTLAGFLAEVGRVANTLDLAVEGLDRAGVAILCRSLSGEDPGAALLDALLRETRGNPLFVSETVRLLLSRGHSLAGEPAGRMPVPERVQAAINARWANLPSAAGELLLLAAVIGMEFDLALLAGTSGQQPHTVLRGLRPAEEAGLVRLVGDTGARFEFTHPLIPRTIAEGLPGAERARLHLRVGRAIERLPAASTAARLPALAYHFTRGAALGEARLAFDYARRAGERAFQQLGYEEAARAFGEALDVAPLAPTLPRAAICEVLIARSEAQVRGGQTTAGKEGFLAAAELSAELALPDLAGRAALGYAGYRGVPGAPDHTAIRLLDAAASATGRDPLVRARVYARLAMELYYVGDKERRDVLTRDAVALARQAGDVPTLAYTLLGRHYALHEPENLHTRLASGDELSRLAESAGDREVALLGHYLRVRDAFESGDVEGARSAAHRHAELAAVAAQPLHSWRVMLVRFIFAHFEGRLAEAEALLGAAYQMAAAAEIPNARSAAGAQMIMVRLEQGRLPELLPELTGLTTGSNMAGWRAGRAMALAAAGEVDAARETIQSLTANNCAAVPSDEGFLGAAFAIAYVARQLHDAEAAAQLYPRLAPFEGRLVMLVGPTACAGPVSNMLGRLAETMGAWRDAERHYRAAIRAATQGGSPLWEAHARLGLGSMLRARGAGSDAERALVHLEKVITIARPLGLAALEADARALLEPTAGASSNSPAGLSAREVEVLALLAEGLTNREIAQRLVVSVRTVDAHVTSIYRKVNARRRGDAVAFAIHAGLVREAAAAPD